MVVYVIPCLAFALNMLDHVISWYMTIVRHGCLYYSMLSFWLEHGWSWYIMVHDYGLTWLSMLFHVLPCLLPWTWLIILYHGIFFTWSDMENYCLLLPDHFNIRSQLTMIKRGHCVHCFLHGWPCRNIGNLNHGEWREESGLYIRAGSRRSSPASLQDSAGCFHYFKSQDMARRW